MRHSTTGPNHVSLLNLIEVDMITKECRRKRIKSKLSLHVYSAAQDADLIFSKKALTSSVL